MDRKYKVGDLLYFVPENMTIVLVMVSTDGVRYIDMGDLSFKDDGSLVTWYASIEALDEGVVYHGNVSKIVTKTHPIMKGEEIND